LLKHYKLLAIVVCNDNRQIIILIISSMKYFLVFVALGLMVSCQTKPPVQTPLDPVIMTIGNKKIMTDEFFQSFTKNQFSDDTTKKTSIEEYLKLYTNLKLKVMSAQSQGADTTEGFKLEMASYRNNLARPFMTDKVLVDNMVAESYERLKQEVRASHILIAVAPEASADDTLAAYKAAMALRGRIASGEEDFAEMAKKYSKDTKTAAKGGDLGYFTAFQTLYALENPAYRLPLNQISTPIRTASGYHLLKPTNRRPARGSIQVAHILVRISASGTDDGKKAAKNRIESAYERLKQEAWDNVCREFSDDITSKTTGGVLSYFTTGENTPSFEEATYTLKEIGEVSAPFLTNYGWHIAKLVGRKPIESFEILAPALRSKITTHTRGEYIQSMINQKLRKNYELKEASGMPERAFENIDSSLIAGRWKFTEPLDESIHKKPIFSVDNKSFTVNEFFDFVKIKQEPRPKGTSMKVLLNKYYQQFIDKKLALVEEENLANKNPEFKALMTEIYDGMLLSQQMEKNVWEKSLIDSVGQRAVYERTKENYRYPARAWGVVATTDSDSLLNRAKMSLAKMPYQLRRKGPDLLFDLNDAYITEAHKESLFEVGATMYRNENYLIEVSAFSDVNELDTISAERLKRAVKALTLDRMSLSRVMEKDNGKYNPVADAARNRRVSFQYFTNSVKDVEKALNSLKIGSISIQDGVFIKDQNKYLNAAQWEVGEQMLMLNGKRTWLKINKIDLPRTKTFAEARGAAINEYQRQLEAEWLAKLNQQFPVKINDEELKKLK
jgi:peptidyl-prolyl cis-trans isomerase SurA